MLTRLLKWGAGGSKMTELWPAGTGGTQGCGEGITRMLVAAAVRETAILLHFPSALTRCFNGDGEGTSAMCQSCRWLPFLELVELPFRRPLPLPSAACSFAAFRCLLLVRTLPLPMKFHCLSLTTASAGH